ncbi:MAG: carboxypeptidase-like regulatory domain-containing protein [Cyclobacteriaceae bacterium]
MSFGQTNIAGKIVNIDGDEIAFAHIYNRSNGLGRVSDINGKFDLIASKGDTIDFSFVGYQNHFIVVNSTHLASYLKVTLPENSHVLPSITIYADSEFRVPLNPQFEPMTIEGVTIDTDKPPIRPGQITAGGGEGIGGIPAGGVTINGPITYFSKDEKEKRKAVKVKKEDNERITYSQFITQDSIRQKLMYLYQIDSSQYSRLMLRLNREFPGVQKANTDEEIWHWIINFFNEAVPVIKVFDMH